MKKPLFIFAFLHAFLCATFASAGFNGGDDFGKPGFSQYSTGTAAVNYLTEPFFSTNQLPNSGTSIEYGAFGSGFSLAAGSISTSSTARMTPIAIDGTFSGLSANLGSAQSGVTIQTRFNGTLGNLTCAFGSPSVPGTPCTDTTHFDPISAGALIQYVFDPHGSTWVQGTTPGQVSILLKSSFAQQASISSGPYSTALGTATRYYPIGMQSSATTTDVGASVMFPVPGKITGFYVYPNGNDNGTNPHYFTLCQNGTSACAANVQTGGMSVGGVDWNLTLGGCVNVGASGNIGGNALAPCGSTTAVNVAAGDTFSVQGFCLAALPNTAGTCNNITPTFAVRWEPTNLNQVPLFASVTNEANPSYAGLSALEGTTAPGTRLSWQIAPALTTPSTMTFSNLLSCMQNAPTGVTFRTAQFEYATSTIAPNTNATLMAVVPAATPCSGAMSGTFLAGFQDTVNSFSTAASGYTFDTALTASGIPPGAGVNKISMVVTIP